MTPLKPGVRTTEILAAALAGLATLGTACASLIPARFAVEAGIAIAGIYTLSRTLTKVAHYLAQRPAGGPTAADLAELRSLVPDAQSLEATVKSLLAASQPHPAAAKVAAAKPAQP